MSATNYYDIEHYFVDRKQDCLAFFGKAAKNGKRAVYAKYGQKRGQQLLEQVKVEYENLLPQVPYVGETAVWKQQMLLTVLFAAFYRVLQEQENIDDIWILCRNFNRESLLGMPRLVRWFLKQSTFSNRTKKTYKILAEEHKQKNLADQWDFVEGNGNTFDYGMNMTRCAKLIFLQNIGAEEFAPYVCLIDENFAECCNYGLKRTKVLAEGADYCDFRLSKNGPVDVRTSVNLWV